MPPADAPRPDSISASSPRTAASGASPEGDGYAPSALPSTFARALAFVSILVGGLCGGLIGWSLVDLTCEGDDCGVAAGLAGLAGAVIGAGGVAVVAVLALRAMGEWRTIQHRQAQAEPPADRRRR